jgi:hypothetical protein
VQNIVIVGLVLIYLLYSISSSVKKTKYFNNVENDGNYSLERMNALFSGSVFSLMLSIVLSLVLVLYNENIVQGLLMYGILSVVSLALSRIISALVKKYLFIEQRDYLDKSINIKEKRKSLLLGVHRIIVVLFFGYMLFYSIFIHTLYFENMIVSEFSLSSEIGAAKDFGLYLSIYLLASFILFLAPMKALLSSCLRIMEK